MKEEAVSTEAEAGPLDPDELSEVAFTTCTDLLRVLERDPTLAADLGSKFEPALSDIVKITISPLAPKFGAFTVTEGCMVVNAEDAARLFSYVISDMKAHLIDDHGALDPDEVRTTLNDTLALFVLHEVRHRTQGVGNFGTVQLLKKIDGREHISKFDIQADRDAALALAAARTGTTQSAEFLEYYQRALYYSVQYFFKIYPANVERLDKTCRVAALLLMLARLQVYMAIGKLEEGRPTDALHVTISEDKQSIAVFANEPFERLLRAANDISEIPSFVRNIETGKLQDALGQALRLAVALKLN